MVISEFAAMILLSGSLLVTADAGFHPASTAAACAAGKLFKTDFMGLGCYTDDHNPKYYEAVHQQQEDARLMRLYAYGGIGAAVALVLALLWFFSGTKPATVDKKR